MNQLSLFKIQRKRFSTLLFLLIAFLISGGSHLYAHNEFSDTRTSSSSFVRHANAIAPNCLHSSAFPTASTILRQPSDTAACSGNPASFSVSTTGALAFQWQEFSLTWSNLTNAGVYSGATDSVLVLSTITGLGGRQYRCIVTGITPPADTTLPATLTENFPPALSVQPVDTTTCSGNTAAFTLTATGSGLRYQWQVDTGSGFIPIPTGGPYLGDTTANLVILSDSSSMNGYHYRCIVSGTCAPSLTSSIATLHVNSPPAIVVQPAPALICAGDSTSFSIQATGAGLMYQWQADQGFGMANLTDSVPYSGTATATLKITGATAAMDGFTYQCVVTGICNPPVTSENPTLNVNAPPSIDYSTLSPSICAGDNTSFFILTSGIVNTYQWQVSKGYGFTNLTDSLPYAGTSTQYMTLTGATAAMNGYIYQCVVSGVCAPPAISAWDTLFINTGPKIYFPPQDTAMCDGTSAIFAVQALGLGITFQWQEDQGTGFGFVSLPESFPYSGTTTDSLTITGINQTMDTYKYRCIVSGTCSPGDTSAAGTLYFNTSVLVYSLPVNSVVCAGSPTTFSLLATGNNLTYQWQVDQGSGFTNLTNSIPYSGATTDSLIISKTSAGMDGFVYRCLVTNTCGPSDSSSVALLNVNTAPAISLQPADTTICPGNNASFMATASGTALTYQWQIDSGGGMHNLTDTLFYTGTSTPLLSLTGAPASADGYKFRCLISGICPPTDTSIIASLHINAIPAIALQPRDTTVCEGANAAFNLKATGTGIIYQWQVDAGSGFVNLKDTAHYSGSSATSLLISSTSGNLNGYKFRCILAGVCLPADTSTAAVLHIRLIPSITSQPVASTLCAGSNALFAVGAAGTTLAFQWQVDKGSGFTNLTNNATYSGVTTDSLSVASASAGLDGYTFHCIVSGACSPPVTSTNVQLHINEAPAIQAQPLAATLCEGNNAQFVVKANGTALIYQWQVDQGTGFINLSNTPPYSGVTSDTLHLTAPSSSLDGYLYQCILSGTCSPADTSVAVALHFHASPQIVSQPLSSTICSGNNTTFTIAATGTSLTYQWQVNQGSGFVNTGNVPPYSGAGTSSLHLSAPGIALDGYVYRCIVSGVCTPSDTSVAAALHINTAAAIASQPASSTVCIGDKTVFTVAATGSGLTYQWQLDQGAGFSDLANAAPYSGATSASLVVTGVSSSLNGYIYRCIVSGVCPPADTSIQVILHVNPAPAITSQPVHTTVCSGGNASFVVGATGSGISYQWMVNTGTGFTALSNSSPYSGVTTNTLTITAASATLNGYMYECMVTYACPVPVLSSAVALTVFSAPQIVSEPADNTICEGSVATFTSGVSGDSLSYQWQVNQGSGFSNISNNATYFGANSPTLVISATTAAMNGYQYNCIIKGICAPVITTSPATLYIKTAPKITSEPVDALVCSGNTASFVVAGTGPGLSYQWQVDSGAGFVTLINSSFYTGVTKDTLTIRNVVPAMDSFRYQCIVYGTCNPSVLSDSVFLRVNPNTLILIQPADSTICPGANTRFGIKATGASLSYQWQANSGPGFTNLTNGALYSGVTSPTLIVTGATAALDGTIYQCIVSSGCSAQVISAGAVLRFHALPTITIPPADARICDGTNTAFAVSASGATLSYQWQVQTGTGFTNLSNTAPYSGATTSTLIITGASLAMNGYQYQCIVTGLCGPSVLTPPATLSIDVAPSVTTPPSDASVCSEGSTQFTLVAKGSGIKYQWQVNTGSGFVDLSDNSVYSGTTTVLLTISGANVSMTGYLYRVVVTGNCTPSANSASAILTVLPLPTLASTSDTTLCSGVLVPARYFTSVPAGATIDWANNNTLIGLSSGGKATTSVPTFVAQNGTSKMINGLITVIPQLSGCYGSPSSYTIHVNPLPVVSLNLGSLNPECLNMVSVPLAGGLPPGGQYAGTAVSSGNFSPSAAGIGSFPITYTYADSNSCVSSATSPINVDVCTGMSPADFADLHIDVYPNPFANKLSVILDQDKTDVQVHIYNSGGQLIEAQLFSGKVLEMETGAWPAGMYYIRVQTLDGLTVKKIIKD